MTDEDVTRLARALPFAEPSRDQVEEMRTAVIAAMPAPAAPKPRRRRWVVGAFAVAASAAAAAAATVAIRIRAPSPAGPKRHATIAGSDARFTRVGSDLVWLADGIVQIDDPPDEQLRVMVGDGEVSARGAAFEVEAHLDHLSRVFAHQGRVEVQSGGQVRVLDRGERWDAPVAVAPVIAAAPPTIEPRHVVRTRVIAKRETNDAPSKATPAQLAERTFRTGWDALQVGDAETAAAAFDRVVTLDPHGALADDAEFWRASALQRMGRIDAARAAYVTFLADFPRSVRAGEASVLLGWLLLGANDLAGAEAQFKQASADRVARVHASAEAGLAEIARRR